MENVGLTTELYILIGMILIPSVSQLVREFFAWRKGEDHNAIAELKAENETMKAQIDDLRNHIYKLEGENAQLKGFIAGVSQNEQVKQLFSQILEESKK